MSENLDLVRTLLSATDPDLIEAARRGEAPVHLVYTEDVVLDLGDFEPPGLDREYRGLDGARRYWMDWLGPWAEIEYEAELHEAGDTVVVVLDQRMRGAHSGIDLTGRYAQLFRFRDGKIAYWRIYMNPDDALADAGIEPGATAAESFRAGA